MNNVVAVEIETVPPPELIVPAFSVKFAHEVDLNVRETEGMHYFVNAQVAADKADHVRALIQSRLEQAWQTHNVCGVKPPAANIVSSVSEHLNWMGTSLAHRERVALTGRNYIGYIGSGFPPVVWGCRTAHKEDVRELRFIWHVLRRFDELCARHLKYELSDEITRMRLQNILESSVLCIEGLHEEQGVWMMRTPCVASPHSDTDAILAVSAFTPEKWTEHSEFLSECIEFTMAQVMRTRPGQRVEDGQFESFVIASYVPEYAMRRLLQLFPNPFSAGLVQPTHVRGRMQEAARHFEE